MAIFELKAFMTGSTPGGVDGARAVGTTGSEGAVVGILRLELGDSVLGRGHRTEGVAESQLLLGARQELDQVDGHSLVLALGRDGPAVAERQGALSGEPE